MSRIDELVEFRIADISEADEIMQFIHDYWKPTHILARDKDFFLYEYGNGDKLNFLVAHDRSTNELIGIYGFYMYSSAESFANGTGDCAGGLSKVKDDCSIPFVGLEMYKKLPRILKSRSIIGVGLNFKTSYKLVSRALHMTVGKMKQYYRLSDCENYKIAVIKNKYISTLEDTKADFVEISSFEQYRECFNNDLNINRLPYKDNSYIEKRYFNHPVYKYHFLLINKSTMIVYRIITCNGSTAIRIVDILGNAENIVFAGLYFDQVMKEYKSEYVDIMENGVPDDLMRKAGFTELAHEGENIIPNYFEPYVPNIIDVYYDSSYANSLIFKADADQDRPS